MQFAIAIFIYEYIFKSVLLILYKKRCREIMSFCSLFLEIRKCLNWFRFVYLLLNFEEESGMRFFYSALKLFMGDLLEKIDLHFGK